MSFGIRHLSRALGVSPRTIMRLVDRGEFPAPARVGRRLVWPRDVVARWLDERQEAAEAARRKAML